MANSLNRSLTNCLVILGREHYPSDPKWDGEANRTVFVSGGFGANADTSGSALFVRDGDGKSWRAEGYMVERFVREVPVDEREITYIVNVMSEHGVASHEVKATTPLAAVLDILKTLGWSDLPYRLSDQHDDLLIEVKGAEYVLSARTKR
jgi:hypothetical protein